MVILGLAIVGAIMRLAFFPERFTFHQHLHIFFFNILAVGFQWMVLEKIHHFLNRKMPFSEGVVPRVIVQLVLAQIFLYAVVFTMIFYVAPLVITIVITKEIIVSAIVVFMLVNIAANGAIIGHHFFLEWRKSLVRQTMLEKEKSQAHFENLKNQLNPHFLFNSLSSLNSLIFENPDLASKFLKQLSRVYRYLLENNENEAVPLETEISFVQNYISLLQTRFGKGLEVNIKYSENFSELKIIPVTLQILIENAIKHNITYEDTPLVIDIFVEDSCLTVRNNHQPKTRVEGSNKKGLENLNDLYFYTTGKEMLTESSPQYFTVKVPLIK